MTDLSMTENDAKYMKLNALVDALHDNIPHGKSGTIAGQVQATATRVRDWANEHETSYITALLHKSMETKRIAEGVAPLTVEEIAHGSDRCPALGVTVATDVELFHNIDNFWENPELAQGELATQINAWQNQLAGKTHDTFGPTKREQQALMAPFLPTNLMLVLAAEKIANLEGSINKVATLTQLDLTKEQKQLPEKERKAAEKNTIAWHKTYAREAYTVIMGGMAYTSPIWGVYLQAGGLRDGVKDRAGWARQSVASAAADFDAIYKKFHTATGVRLKALKQLRDGNTNG